MFCHCILILLLPANEVVGRSCFQSYVIVCSYGGSHVSITNDALDLTLQRSSVGTLIPIPTADIWWPRLETCSNLFTLGPPPHVFKTSGNYWSSWASERSACYWMLSCITYIPVVIRNDCFDLTAILSRTPCLPCFSFVFRRTKYLQTTHFVNRIYELKKKYISLLAMIANLAVRSSFWTLFTELFYS